MAHDAVKQRRRRRAREELARYKTAKARGGPPPDKSFFAAVQDLLRSTGEVKLPFSEHPGVFRAISVIAGDMGGVPWRIWNGPTEDKKTEVLAGPWYDLFGDPSPDFDLAAIWLAMRVWCLLDGEAFWILRKRDGRLADPREIPGRIDPVRAAGMKERFSDTTGAFVGWELDLGGSRGKVPLLREQVVHFRPIPDPENPRRGIAPLSPLKRSIRTDSKAHAWNEASLDNNAEPGAVLERDKDAPDLSPEQLQQLRQQYVDQHSGPGNARRPLVLAGGMKLNTFGWTPHDMEYGEQRRWSRFEIASAYGVPLMLMGDMSEVHSKESARAVLKLYWENTVRPRLLAEARALDRQLFLGRGQGDTSSSQRIWAEPDLSGIAALQTEESERRANAEADRRLGFPLNEINRRHELGYKDQGETGNVGLVSGGLIPVDAVGYQFPDEPAPPPQEPAEAPADGEPPRGTYAPIVRKFKSSEVDRAVLWHQYIRGIQRPGEQKMRVAVLTWMKDVRRQVLRFVDKAGRGVRNTRTLTELELGIFLAEREKEWNDALVAKTTPVTEWVVDKSLARLAAQVGDAPFPNKTSPEMLRFMERMSARKVTYIGETVRTNLRAELIEGVGLSENVTQLQDRVKAVMNAGASRSLAIARTETGAASTGSRFVAAPELGVKRISWLSSRDDEVRDTHRIDGEVRELGGRPFSNGLEYPLDADGPAGEVVNCRCDWIPEDDEIQILA